MKKQVSILLGLCSGTKYLLCDETFGPGGKSLGKSKDHISLSYAYGDGGYESCELAENAVSELLYGYNSAFLIILIGILAFAVGISGFQFMHKKEKLDFYHGLALKRHQLFAISYLAGLFLFLIPYIVCLSLIHI